MSQTAKRQRVEPTTQVTYDIIRQVCERARLKDQIKSGRRFNIQSVLNDGEQLILLSFGSTLKATRKRLVHYAVTTESCDLCFRSSLNPNRGWSKISLYPRNGSYWLRFGSICAPVTLLHRDKLLDDLSECFVDQHNIYSEWRSAVICAAAKLQV